MIGMLGVLVEMSLKDPSPELLEVCGDYYRPYYRLMYMLAQLGGLCVELGVEKARGCGAMALAGAEVIGIDHTRRPEVDVMRKRFKNFTFMERSSLPPPDLEPISLLHLDTEHTYAQAREEFNAYKPLLAEGAVVLFDDLHAENDGVAKFFWTLPHPKIQDDRLHECGYGVLAYV